MESQSARPMGAHLSTAAAVPLLILGAASVAILPLAVRGNSCGHDFNFHLLSWMEVAGAWRHGLAYPHWIGDANYGAGEPRLIFYPPASWILGALLGSVVSWTAAPTFFVLLALAVGGGSMYLLAREWAGPEGATLAACLYAVNPYALFNAYERSAFGELLAGAVLPLVVLYAVRRDRTPVMLGVTLAAVWLCDAPAAVLACYTVCLIALLRVLLERKIWPLLHAAGGVLLGLSLAAFYVLPAAYERRWVAIERSISTGLRVQDSFLFARTGDLLHDQVLRTASWIFVAGVIVAAVAAWLARKGRTGSPLILALLLPPLLFLQFPVSLPLWQSAPELKFIQFPWRWALVVSVAACALLGAALDRRKSPAGFAKSTWLRRAFAAAAVLVLVAAGERAFFQPCDDQDAVAPRLAAFHAGPIAAGVEGSDEYTPRGADNAAIQRGLPLVRVLKRPRDDSFDDSNSQIANPEWEGHAQGALSATVTFEGWNAENRTIQIESPAAGYAVLRLMDYPAWRVTLNGRTVELRPRRADGLMVIPLVAGSNKIGVRWKTTPDVFAGNALSLIALLVLIPLGMSERRRQKSRFTRQVS